MKHRNGVMRATRQTAAVATLATVSAVAALGRKEAKSAFAPINAMSHVAFGDEAETQDRASAKFTLTGLLLGTAGIACWSFLQETLLRKTKLGKMPMAPVAVGAAVSAVAYAIDYHVVPKRLTPGIEKRLSNKAVVIVYAALAAGLTAGALISARRSDKT